MSEQELVPEVTPLSSDPVGIGAMTRDEVLELVRGFVHSIRNPLAVIRSSAEVGQHLGGNAGPLSGYLDSVVREVDRVELAVRGLQRLVRLEPEPADELSTVTAVDLAVEIARGGAEAEGVALAVSGGPELVVRLSHDHMQAALAELLDNAIRVSPAGSTVEVSWEAAGTGTVALHVSDRGPGVARERAASLLRPFVSTHRGRLGLGLAVVDRICRLAGGRLRWQNRGGGGCRFTLMLPGTERVREPWSRS